MKLLSIVPLFFLEYRCELYRYDWTVAKTPLNPDRFAIKKQATINGQLPGPEIRVPYASEIEVKVTNKLDHGLTLHWHGITQKNSLEVDGVPYITQDPISPDESYTYRFTTGDEAGTFWYHAHTGLDGANVFGALIINDNKTIHRYEEERMLILSDYYHKDLDQAYVDLMRVPFVAIGDADSILINGITTHNSTGNHFTKINVKPNKRYRLRIIGAQDHSFYRFKIQNHNMTVIEADGTLVNPFTVDHIDVNSGTRYSVIIETSNIIEDSLISVQMINEGNKVKNGIAVLHYDGAKTNMDSLIASFPNNTATNEDSTFEEKLTTSITKHNPNYYPVPMTYDQELIFNSSFAVVDKLPLFKINDVIYKPRNTTLLNEIKANPNIKVPGVYEIIANGNAKQFIYQHFTVPGRKCEQHPWHLHGHDFYVVGKGSGVYHPKRDHIKVDSDSPPILRDTFTFLPQTKRTPLTKSDDPNSCGWYAIRFIADNPGLWIMHCHNASHMVMGKQAVIYEKSETSP